MNTAALTVLTINNDAQTTINTHVRAAQDERETGGILLGHERPGRIDVVTAGDPGPRADRRSDYFLRDLDHSRRLADFDYRQHATIWVGEWHTHPRGPAYPSMRDITTHRELLADVELHFDLFVSIIVSGRRRRSPSKGMSSQGVDQSIVDIHAWIIDQETVVNTKLHRVS